MVKIEVGSNISDKFEEKVERIVKKVVVIADTYFKYPLIVVNNLGVPFDDYDVLRIRFKEPVKLTHDASSRCDADGCTASVKTYLATRSIVEIKWSFRNGIARYMEARDIHGYIYYFDIYPTLDELAQLFTPDIFKRTEEAEIRSEYGIAEKWFANLIDVYREVKKLVSSVSLNDLYDVSRTVNGVFIEFSDFRLDDVEYATIIIYLNRIFNTVEIDVPALHDRIYCYANSGEFIWRGGNEIRSLIMKFPEKLIDDIEKFLKKFLEAYLYTSIAVRYIQYVF